MSAIVFSLIAGGLFSLGVFLILRRSAIKALFGLVLLGNATNLVVFVSAGTTRGHAPLIREGTKLEPPYADPLAQALILTAIVISFAVLAFAMVLVRRMYDSLGTDDVDMVMAHEEDDLE